VDEVAHFGEVLRVATRAGRDPAGVVTRVLGAAGIAIGAGREVRATVEDAFVSMVREDARSDRAGAAA
jgi:hypothetical protein